MLEMFETGKPWIIWQYIRSDFFAMILGGLIRGECLICGETERIKLSRESIFFPPTNSLYRHPKRDEFISKHLHSEAQQKNRILWAIPLKNI